MEKSLNLVRGKDFSTTLFLLTFNCHGSTDAELVDLKKPLSCSTSACINVRLDLIHSSCIDKEQQKCTEIW